MTTETDLERRIYQHEAVMRKIAANYPKNSEEEIALRLGHLAYFFVVCHHDDQFQQYLANLGKPLSEEQKAFLKKIGIKDPETPDNKTL
jgi:hypothetical protein